jgi:hypothetical protein
MMEWTEKAKTIPLGQKIRSDCFVCGPKNTAVISHSIKGYSYFCFRCDEQSFIGKGQQTLAELARIKELNEQAKVTVPIRLPKDFSEEIPLVGRLWLYKAGITESVWKEYGFGWSEEWQRVVMPIYEDNKLIWFQARAVLHGQKPKYLNPTGDRESLVFFSKTRSDLRNDTITVVEDILSAIRVGTITPTASLLGTKITTAQANRLAKFRHVRTWLDNDRAGIQGAYKVRRCCGLVCEVSDVRTDLDPKCYSNDEIREILYGTKTGLHKNEPVVA